MLQLEENEIREDLPWKDQHEQYMKLIMALRKRNPNITFKELGEELNLDESTVRTHCGYEKDKHKPSVAAAAETGGLKAGYRAAVRLSENEFADQINGIIHIPGSSRNTHSQSPIQTTSFHDWAPAYSGPKFNLLNCDFPYGVDAHKHAGQNSVMDVDYLDDEKTYWELARHYRYTSIVFAQSQRI